jgi:hypothetical protein
MTSATFGLILIVTVGDWLERGEIVTSQGGVDQTF